MDALAALADQLGTVNAHLPLTEGMYNYDAVELISTIYMPSFRLDQSKYAESQVYRNANGKLAIDIVEASTGNVLMTFINMVSPPVEKVELTPVKEVVAFLFEPLKVDMTEELEFLKGMQIGAPLEMFETANTQAYELATLLNNYNYNGRWMAGTFGELSTCGFELVFLGDSKKAPEGFVVGLSSFVAIIKLRCGNTPGYVCLRT